MLLGVQTEVAGANKGQTSINRHFPKKYLVTSDNLCTGITSYTVSDYHHKQSQPIAT